MSFAQLLRRGSPQKVHEFLPQGICVPGYVRNFLGKGAKFVPDVRRSQATQFTSQMKAFKRNLDLAILFKDSRGSFPQQRLRIPNSNFQPPSSESSELFCRLLHKELSNYLPVDRPRQNYDWFDKAALNWLFRHRDQIMVCDSDKNLGDVVIDRQVVMTISDRLVEESFASTTLEEAKSEILSAQNDIDEALQHHATIGTVDESTVKYIKSRFAGWTPGSFRCRLKIHKPQLSGRPIVNLTRSWLQPIARYIVATIAVIASICRYVIASSSQLVDLISGLHAPDDFILMTADIKNLYPSIDLDHFEEKFAEVLKKHPLGHTRKGSLLRRLVRIVLRTQHIHFKGRYFKAIKGFCTGLACGVQLANAYLDALDCSFCERFQADLLFYRRYVDDAICCIRRSRVHEAMKFLNAWHPSIEWELTAAGNEVPFLDLVVAISDGDFTYRTHRKDMNQYLYLPFDSCHKSSTFVSIITCEVARLFRTNARAQDTDKQVQFFVDKLVRRGYPLLKTRQLAYNVLHRLRKGPSRNTRKKESVRKVFLKAEFSFSLNSRALNAALIKHRHLLPDDIKLGVAHTVQPNLFRKLYQLNWG